MSVCVFLGLVCECMFHVSVALCLRVCLFVSVCLYPCSLSCMMLVLMYTPITCFQVTLCKIINVDFIMVLKMNGGLFFGSLMLLGFLVCHGGNNLVRHQVMDARAVENCLALLAESYLDLGCFQRTSPSRLGATCVVFITPHDFLLCIFCVLLVRAILIDF